MKGYAIKSVKLNIAPSQIMAKKCGFPQTYFSDEMLFGFTLHFEAFCLPSKTEYLASPI
jgi:hypothetical protein